MPTELVFANGATVKVTAEMQDVVDALKAGQTLLESTRFAGFRGDEAVAGEWVIVNLPAIAHAIAIASP